MSTQTRRGTRKMIILAVASFGFAFAMVPLYNIACEKVFGIKLDNSASAVLPFTIGGGLQIGRAHV